MIYNADLIDRHRAVLLMMEVMRKWRAALWAFLLVVTVVAVFGCAGVRFNERETLSDPMMAFDPNPAVAEMQSHMRLPREASIGGFAPVGAGGCACK